MVFNLARKIIPAPIKPVIKLVNSKMPKALTAPLKFAMELDFQKGFAKQFEANPSMILEDWKTNHALDKILEICNIQNTTRVLDVGCGIASVLHFVGGERHGIDPLADEYKKIYSYPKGMTILKGSSEDIPFPKDYFDVVFSSNALDHCSSPRKTIEEICRVLKSGGYFILSVEVFPNNKPRGFEHPHTFTKGFVRSLVGAKFRTVFEKASMMMEIGSRKCGSKEEYFLAESANPAEELTLLLRKKR